MTCADKTALGAYVLGALDRGERDRVDEHVAQCARCREELEALIPVRAYLARLAPADLEAGAVPPAPDRLDMPPAPGRADLPPAVVRAPLPRRGLPALAALAAGALLALAAWARGGDEPSGTRSSAADARTGVRASVAATSRLWGTELRVRMSGASPGERCRLIARARDGRGDVAATWWTTHGGSAEVTGAAAIRAADLVALDVVTATGHRLVHVPMNR